VERAQLFLSSLSDPGHPGQADKSNRSSRVLGSVLFRTMERTCRVQQDDQELSMVQVSMYAKLRRISRAS
jgi:hypothetical protein